MSVFSCINSNISRQKKKKLELVGQKFNETFFSLVN